MTTASTAIEFEEVVGWGEEPWDSDVTGVAVDSQDRVYALRRGDDAVTVMDADGSVLSRWGPHPSIEVAFERMPGGAPFNRPTKAAVSPTGELFVSDGYRNCRVHRFSADRRDVLSWGGPGAAPGSFVIPHSVTLDADGRVHVCDRENDRIQIFSRDGDLLDIWDDVQRPTDLAFDERGFAYVTELARGPRT